MANETYLASKNEKLAQLASIVEIKKMKIFK